MKTLVGRKERPAKAQQEVTGGSSCRPEQDATPPNRTQFHRTLSFANGNAPSTNEVIAVSLSSRGGGFSDNTFVLDLRQ
jgi:hypothetical protein